MSPTEKVTEYMNEYDVVQAYSVLLLVPLIILLFPRHELYFCLGET